LRNHVLPAFGSYRMNRVTRSDVVAFHHSLLDKGYAAGTCNRVLILLKFVYNCAIRWDVLPPTGNPCVGVDEFENTVARERYLTTEEVRRLFDELDTNRNVQVGQVIRLLLYTGARKREILDAKWEEIDFSRQLLTVPPGRSKSKKPRHIPLSDAAIELLQSLPRQEDIPWVFSIPRPRSRRCRSFTPGTRSAKRSGWRKCGCTICATATRVSWSMPDGRCTRCKSSWVTTTRR